MSAPEIWRVVDELGGVREVPVRADGAQMLVGAGPGPRVWPGSTMPRLAVASLAVSMGWPVREILAPEDAERAALLGGLLAVIHRDGGHYLAQHGAEYACGDAVRRVLADREGLALSEREHVAAERARCAAVVDLARAYLDAVDAWECERDRWRREYVASPAAQAVVLASARKSTDAARDALDAALGAT